MANLLSEINESTFDNATDQQKWLYFWKSVAYLLAAQTNAVSSLEQISAIESGQTTPKLDDLLLLQKTINTLKDHNTYTSNQDVVYAQQAAYRTMQNLRLV